MIKALVITAALAAAAVASAWSVASGAARSHRGLRSRDGPSGYAHVVEPGETLSKISRDHYGTADRWKEIAVANGITDASKIAVGSRLVIPGYVPPPEESDAAPEPLVLSRPILHSFPWRVFARMLAAYAITSVLLGAVVLSHTASRMGIEPRGMGRSAAAMAMTSVSLASVITTAVCFASIFSAALSRSIVLSAGAAAVAVAAAFSAAVVVMRFSFATTAGRSAELAASYRLAMILSALAAAGLVYLLASGDLSAAAAFIAGS